MAMLAGPLRALDCRIRPAVAWITKRDQVPQVVSIPVAVEAIQAEGANVMHIRSRSAAMLACVIVPLERFSALGLPVRPAIVREPAQVLRMVEPVPVQIPAGPGAILPAPATHRQPAPVDLESLAAMKARALLCGVGWSSLDRRILASPGAILPAPVLCSGCNRRKGRAAMLACRLDPRRVDPGVGRLPPYVCRALALIGAIPGLLGAVGPYIKRAAARLACDCNHICIIPDMGRGGYGD